MAGLVKVARGRWISDPKTGESYPPGTVLAADHPAALANSQLCRAIRGGAAEKVEAITPEPAPDPQPEPEAVDIEADAPDDEPWTLPGGEDCCDG